MRVLKPKAKSERERESKGKVGLPIGNLTSQLFANIYLDELDQFIKHKLKIKYYLRYCDDFVILESNPDYLQTLIKTIDGFLQQELKLSLSLDKVIICKLKQGIDFLGYVVLPHRRILRTKTKHRMLQKVNLSNFSSYQGLLKHCNGHYLEQRIRSLIEGLTAETKEGFNQTKNTYKL